MKRKILITLLAAIMLLTSASALFACDKTPADVYSGSLSKTGYATENDAAKAYLQAEFAGETGNVVFESYEKKQDLTRKEIEKLPLGEYKADDVEKAEKGKIKYVESSKSKETSDDEIEVQVTFIVLVFVDGKYHHCDLVALPGEKISKSYYTSVLDLSQYDSYVFETEATFRGQSVPAGEMELTFSTTQKMIYTKNAIYLEMKTEGMSGTPGMQDINLVSYVIPKDDSSCHLIIKNKLSDGTEGEWTYSNVIPGNLKDYSANMIMAMDQTYFIKTDDGFKLDEKKYAQYLEKIYGQLFEILTVGVEVKTNKASAVYHVTDGYLSAAEGEFDLTLTDGKDTMKLVTGNTITVSDINKANLTVPQEVSGLIK